MSKPLDISRLVGGTTKQLPESRPSLRILLAEDGVVNQRVACGLLEKDGHKIVVANNGREAVDSFMRETFDLVLMDVQMPEMDGFEATAAIRQIEITTGKHVQIIAMTAHALMGDRERCLQAGMNNYLSKPIRPENLYALLEGITPAAKIGGESTTLESVIDWNAALEQMGGSEAMLQLMVNPFIEEANELLPAIRDAVAEHNMAEVGRLAHTLKGTAFCFAAEATVVAAAHLESLGRNNERVGVVEACDALELEINRLAAALTDFAAKNRRAMWQQPTGSLFCVAIEWTRENCSVAASWRTPPTRGIAYSFEGDDGFITPVSSLADIGESISGRRDWFR